MKIDLAVLRAIEKAGGSAAVLLAAIEVQVEAHEAKRAKRRPVEVASKRKRAVEAGGTEWKQVEPSDTKRQEATLSDNPRARLFREGTAALMTLGRTERAARGLIASWLKKTHDDEQLVLATIMKAQSLAVADYAGWINSTLKGKTGNGQRNPAMGAFDDLITRSEGGEVARDSDLVDVTHGRT